MNQDFEYEGEIVDIIELSSSVKHFVVKVLNKKKFEFVPGQFVMISFPDMQHTFPYRSYSIAGCNDSRFLEFCIVLKKDGAATPLLFSMQTGHRLQFTAALGKFVLPDNLLHAKLCLICTGTGVAPFRAMIQHLHQAHWPVEHVTLIFGCRTEQDLLYKEEFDALSLEFPHKFSYKPVLSRQEWDGNKGYVHTLYFNKPEFMPPSNYLFFICGWSEMVKQSKNNLKEMGYSRKQISFELYD